MQETPSDKLIYIDFLSKFLQAEGLFPAMQCFLNDHIVERGSEAFKILWKILVSSEVKDDIKAQLKHLVCFNYNADDNYKFKESLLNKSPEEVTQTMVDCLSQPVLEPKRIENVTKGAFDIIKSSPVEEDFLSKFFAELKRIGK